MEAPAKIIRIVKLSNSGGNELKISVFVDMNLKILDEKVCAPPARL